MRGFGMRAVLLLALGLALVTVPGVAASTHAAGSTKAAAGNAVELALGYVQRNKHDLGLTGSDIKDLAVSDAYADAATGVTHVYLQQRWDGIDVYDGIINVNVDSDGNVLGAGNRAV